MILDEASNRVGSTRTIFTMTNGGGRAASALKTVAEMDCLFHVQNVVVVHHSFCATSSNQDSVAIPGFERSLKYDFELLREVPR